MQHKWATTKYIFKAFLKHLTHILFAAGACPRDLKLWVLIFPKCEKKAHKLIQF